MEPIKVGWLGSALDGPGGGYDKIHRLANDWRHGSLRALPLEGVPGYYRIRVATDVRLIYRRGEGNTVEILSLIDREDLDRYIRQARTR